ncbi:MAG: anti-sigma factor antagonist (spoIIAA-2)/anti sigma b factor antagonist RsbV [Pseudonocardiales bacterium]|nr:anti-sigma factor antagonist (spoIIAA-2)/anti sigma b factor antagonist RsbV [Jatrophihabitantaceae bacterium]MCW2603165.1 anti-sigma factor antagonist (spoIIAA-2)/anti sigma b factor antagonist RsbV [Pseudonocardiales bacterium]
MTIVLTGEIDASNAVTISSQVEQALDAGAKDIVVDLGAVTFFDSTGLGALIAARTACGSKEVALSLRAPSPQVRRILDLTATASLFPVTD